MYIFVLRPFSEIGSSGEERSGHGCVYPRAGLPGSRWLLPCRLGPGHCRSKPLPLRLRSHGNVPTSVPRGAAHHSCAHEPGAGLPTRTAGHRAGSRATWPWQAGSELRQMAAGGRCHCCPDFFSFWKLKLVRLFSFLCF